jgi:hypothetical protein
MHTIDMREPPIAIGPAVDGSILLLSPKSEPIITQGPEGDLWYLAVYAFGGEGKSTGITGVHPVRAFKTKEDAVCLHDMLVKGQCQWTDVVHMIIRDGRRSLIHQVMDEDREILAALAKF